MSYLINAAFAEILGFADTWEIIKANVHKKHYI